MNDTHPIEFLRKQPNGVTVVDKLERPVAGHDPGHVLALAADIDTCHRVPFRCHGCGRLRQWVLDEPERRSIFIGDSLPVPDSKNAIGRSHGGAHSLLIEWLLLVPVHRVVSPPRRTVPMQQDLASIGKQYMAHLHRVGRKLRRRPRHPDAGPRSQNIRVDSLSFQEAGRRSLQLPLRAAICRVGLYPVTHVRMPPLHARDHALHLNSLAHIEECRPGMMGRGAERHQTAKERRNLRKANTVNPCSRHRCIPLLRDNAAYQ